LLADSRVMSKIKSSDIEAIFDPKSAMKNVDYIFKRAGL
jgi:hypothetical protein